MPDVPIELVFAQPMAANAWHAATLRWRSPAGVVLPLAWRRSEDGRTLRVLPIPTLSPGAHTLTLEAPALFEEGGRSLSEAPVTLMFLVSLMLGADPLP